MRSAICEPQEVNVRFRFVDCHVSFLLEVDFVSRYAQRDVVAEHFSQLLHPDFHLRRFTEPQTEATNDC